MKCVCLDCGYVLDDPYDVITELMLTIDGRRWCIVCGSNNVLVENEERNTMENLKVNIMIDVAKAVAKDNGVSLQEGLAAMLLTQWEELLGAVRDLTADRHDDPRIEDLQKDQVDVLAAVHQIQEWIRPVRQGVDSHEQKVEALMDTVQSLVNTVGDHAKEIVALRQRLGISD